MIKLKDLLLEKETVMKGGEPLGQHGATNTHGSPPIDGKSKTNAKNWIHGKISSITKGFFHDEYWQPIQKMWKEFEKLGLNWTPESNKYEHEVVTFSDGQKHNIPVRKIWEFEIKFINNRDKEDTIYGRMTASGAGPHETPLDRYDVTVTLG